MLTSLSAILTQFSSERILSTTLLTMVAEATLIGEFIELSIHGSEYRRIGRERWCVESVPSPNSWKSRKNVIYIAVIYNRENVMHIAVDS
ncbi:hypothetical protein YC2023_070934 [Brassica napus]